MKRAKRGIALQLIHVGSGMMADASDQLDGVRQLDQIVVGAFRERVSLDRGLLLGR